MIMSIMSYNILSPKRYNDYLTDKLYAFEVFFHSFKNFGIYVGVAKWVTRRYPHPTSRVPVPDFSKICCPNTRPATYRDYPIPVTGTHTRPEILIKNLKTIILTVNVP